MKLCFFYIYLDIWRTIDFQYHPRLILIYDVICSAKVEMRWLCLSNINLKGPKLISWYPSLPLPALRLIYLLRRRHWVLGAKQCMKFNKFSACGVEERRFREDRVFFPWDKSKFFTILHSPIKHAFKNYPPVRMRWKL